MESVRDGGADEEKEKKKKKKKICTKQSDTLTPYHIEPNI